MIYKKDQQVVCINDSFTSYCRYPLTKGGIYTVHSLFQCECGSIQVTLLEYPEILNMRCGCSLSANRRQSYYEWRFMPLDLFNMFISMPEKKTEDLEYGIDAQ